MRELPTGTVTLVFTDIEGSTQLLQQLGRERYARALSDQRKLLREAAAARRGAEVETQGDSFHFAFQSARDAVMAAAEAQGALAAQAWEAEPIRVRIGIHTGEPAAHEDRYAGLDVHRAARVMSAGHGGQILLSETTRALVAADLPEGMSLLDLGEHRLKDLTLPQRIYQLVVDGIPHEFPQLNTLENRPTNLPVHPNPLIGRERERAELADLLGQDDVRLVTLTGAGGTGKTRLALQAAADLLDGFQAGVFFVALAAITDPTLVFPTIAQTLGVRERPSEGIEEALARYLHERELLLLLDNFEQVVAAAPSVAELLRRTRRTRLLVTSREALHVQGERVFPVPTLSLPDPSRLRQRVEGLSQYEAVALFIERARAVQPEFEVTTANAPAVAEICVRLDGLPLALELAAARIPLLPPDELLARLGHRFTLLTGGARDADERQQTLQRAIEWSYDLLSERDRQAFARLGVFVGSFTLVAAEQVGEADLDTLQSLLEKSLLKQHAGRFQMLESIRQYALERLAESGAMAAMRERHAEYFVSRLPSPLDVRNTDRDAFAFLDSELDNLRGAFDEVVERERVDAARRLISSLWFYWIIRGLVREGVERAHRVVSAACESPEEAEANFCASELLRAVGEDERAMALKEAALPFLVNERRASALADIAHIKLERGEIDEARPLIDEAIRIRTELGAPRGIVHARAALAHLHVRLGDYRRAREIEEEDLPVWRASESWTDIATSLLSIGALHRRLGEPAPAARRLRESGELAREIGNVDILTEAVHELGALALSEGRGRSAVRTLAAADAARDATGLRPMDPLDHADVLSRAHAALEPDSFESEWREGGRCELEEAFARVIAELDAQTSTTIAPPSTP